jgi:hypothetical protein
MKRYRAVVAIASFLAVFLQGPILSVAQTPAPAPAAAPAAADKGFSAEQLEQMVAPIALYPDSLLMQVFMAATYPLEVVEAARWREKNKGLTGKDLEEALKELEWDTNIKALCGFPDVLKEMNEKLDWTQDLGDALLGQQADLLDAVQRMRGKAFESGNLKTTEQQTVTQKEDKIIVIQSSNPEVVYVPTYSPTVVYVGWSYPSYYYPAFYAPVPAGYGLMAFGVGVAWGAALSGNCNWGWGHSDVDINIEQNNNFNNNTNNNYQKNQNSNTNAQNKSGNKASFQHNPEHRGGVNYKDKGTASKYGGAGGSNRVSRDQARGYSKGQPTAGTRDVGGAGGGRGAGAGDRAGQQPGAGAGNKAGQQPGAGAGNRAAQQPGGGAGAGAASRGGGGRSSSAYGGSSNPGLDRSASSRGASSSGSRSYGGGGGGRGGGGRGGGRR